jgi:quercetin dioxygenase-like cupin family protein
MRDLRGGRFVGVGGIVVLAASAASALTVNSVVSGTIPFLEETEGPATVAVVDATYAAGEQTPWHYHPGNGYVIVKSGSILNLEPCGGSQVFVAGQAFFEEGGHIHRAIPSATEPTNIVFISVVPEGRPRTIPVDAPICVGPPTTIEECADDGWRQFTVPRIFRNQGECTSYVTRGQP